MADDLQVVDSDLGFSFGMAGMEMWEAVIVEEHDDDDPKKRLIVGMQTIMPQTEGRARSD